LAREALQENVAVHLLHMYGLDNLRQWGLDRAPGLYLYKRFGLKDFTQELEHTHASPKKALFLVDDFDQVGAHLTSVLFPMLTREAREAAQRWDELGQANNTAVLASFIMPDPPPPEPLPTEFKAFNVYTLPTDR